MNWHINKYNSKSKLKVYVLFVLIFITPIKRDVMFCKMENEKFSKMERKICIEINHENG